MRTRQYLAVIAVVLAIAACSSGKKEEQTRTLTERQRDSTIAHSRLPGAGVVGKALEQSDSAKARADRENAADQE
jgi:uncharacterized lipoprotein